jgi:hypothetical protein
MSRYKNRAQRPRCKSRKKPDSFSQADENVNYDYV